MTQPPPTSQPGPARPSAYGWAGHPVPPSGPAIPPVPVAPNGQPLATFGDRFLAYLVDYVILAAVSLVFLVPAVVYQFSVMTRLAHDLAERYPYPGEQPPPGEFLAESFAALAPLVPVYLAVFALTLLAYYVYRVELMFRTGQTVGKRVMKLRVVPLEPPSAAQTGTTQPSVLTRGMAVRRWLVDSVAVQFVPFLFFLDGLWQLWDQPYRQCLHDKVAGTTVVKVGP